MTTTTVLTDAQATTLGELPSVSYHLGGVPSVLTVGDTFRDDQGNRYRVERITIHVDEFDRWQAHLSVTMRDGHHYTEKRTPGAILDQVYNRTLIRASPLTTGDTAMTDEHEAIDHELPGRLDEYREKQARWVEQCAQVDAERQRWIDEDTRTVYEQHLNG